MTGARSFAQLLLLFLYFMSTRLLQTLVETLQAKLLFGISLKMRWKWLFFCASLFFCWNTTPPSWHNKFVHQDICSWFNLGGHFCGLPKHLVVTVFCLLLELHATVHTPSRCNARFKMLFGANTQYKLWNWCLIIKASCFCLLAWALCRKQWCQGVQWKSCGPN